MESDHGLAPGAMRMVTCVWWSDQLRLLVPNPSQFLQPQQSKGRQNLHAYYSAITLASCRLKSLAIGLCFQQQNRLRSNELLALCDGKSTGNRWNPFTKGQ